MPGDGFIAWPGYATDGRRYVRAAFDAGATTCLVEEHGLEAFGLRVFTPPAAPSIGTIVYQEPPPGSRITRQTQILVQATGRLIR